MKIEFKCGKCDEAFSLDVVELTADPELACPSCGARATEEQVEALTSAFDEVFLAVSKLRRKFELTGEVDSEDLPPPYDEAPAPRRGKAPLLDEDEEEDDEDEEDEDEDR